ncbi:hypothetical protein [Virgibacillus salinus]|uniref:Uncharacterized protein n=1 Tax=Virgibacillus salinus TaxID=553311 RepID=A0A1H1DL40_9BACI|nr:hypothetical protein [Virgibacillus salinus]SDQ77177.1 hypothetical protein SAMN05216231_2467 [Virgibacillus salinus]
MGIIMSIILYALTLYIAYLVITVAVRHGIDSSEVGKALKEKQEEKFYPKNDLDKE